MVTMFSVTQLFLGFGTRQSRLVAPFSSDKRETFYAVLKAGWKYAARRKDVLAILVLAATASGGWRMVEILVPAVSTRTALGTGLTGPVYSVVAVGSIGMGLLLARYKRDYPIWWVLLSQLVNIIPFALFVAYPTPEGILVAMLVTGMNADFHDIVVSTYLQKSVPSNFYGRTSGAYRTMLAVGALPMIIATSLHFIPNVPIASYASILVAFGCAIVWRMLLSPPAANSRVISD